MSNVKTPLRNFFRKVRDFVVQSFPIWAMIVVSIGSCTAFNWRSDRKMYEAILRSIHGNRLYVQQVGQDATVCPKKDDEKVSFEAVISKEENVVTTDGTRKSVTTVFTTERMCLQACCNLKLDFCETLTNSTCSW